MVPLKAERVFSLVFLLKISQKIQLLQASKVLAKIGYGWQADLFIMSLCKFDKKILAFAQSACQPRPILAETLDASSDRIC